MVISMSTQSVASDVFSSVKNNGPWNKALVKLCGYCGYQKEGIFIFVISNNLTSLFKFYHRE